MKINVKIPKDLGAITLAQYKHYLDIQSKNKDDKFLQAKMIEIFCDISLSNVYKLKYNDSLEIISILTKMFEQKPQLVKKFKMRGMPTSILINKKGMEFARVIGEIDFAEKSFIDFLQKYN